MQEWIGGKNINFYNEDDLLEQTKYIIHEVKLLKRVFTKKSHCQNCGGKLTKKRKDLLIKSTHFTDYEYKFYEFCRCCGSHFFKKHGKRYFIIDEKSINLRLAKLNKLMKK